VPLRYAAATGWTVALLLRRRPETLVVMSPPAVPAVLAALYGLLTGRVVVVDAHSGAFNRRAWRRMTWLSLRLLDRCPRAAVVVTNGEMAAQAASWTHHPVIQLHDLLPTALPVEEPGSSCDALVVSSWADDEPLDTLAAAMPALAGLRVVVSGRPSSPDAAAALERAGIEVPGFLSDEAYARALAGARVVVALTTREGTMQRGGYEAAARGKALVVSDTRVLREYFGDAAVLTADRPEALASAVREALDRRSQLEQAMRALRDRRAAAEQTGLARLEAVLSGR
jgi:hypothetical protein